MIGVYDYVKVSRSLFKSSMYTCTQYAGKYASMLLRSQLYLYSWFKLSTQMQDKPRSSPHAQKRWDLLRLDGVKPVSVVQEEPFTQQQHCEQSCRQSVKKIIPCRYISKYSEGIRLVRTVALLSSLACERNFSVVKSGFFSSRIRFQKLPNFASAKT